MINSLPVERHEDDRRLLIEWIKDFPLRASKIVIAKDNCNIGQHYHSKKDEVFYLLKGYGRVTLDGDTDEMNEGDIVFVGRGIVHSFWLEKESILLGCGTKPFDPDDELH